MSSVSKPFLGVVLLIWMDHSAGRELVASGASDVSVASGDDDCGSARPNKDPGRHDRDLAAPSPLCPLVADRLRLVSRLIVKTRRY